MHLWFAVTATLLVVAGYAKISNPSPTAGALGVAGLPSHRRAVVTLGAIEVVAGLAGLGLGDGIGGAPVAIVYAGFTGFVVAALARRWPIQRCGCFARIDTPPSWIHVTFNATAAVAAAWRVVTAAPSTAETMIGLDRWAILFALGIIAGVVVAHQLVFALPTRIGRRSPQRA